MSAKFHFEDMDGNVISEHDFLELKRGSTSDPYQFRVVNDGENIPILTITRSGGTEPKLSLDGVSWEDEVNFNLQSGGSMVVMCEIILSSSALFGSDTSYLDAYVNMNYNIEDI